MLKIDHYCLLVGDQPLLTIRKLHLATGKKVLITGGNKTGKSLFLSSINGEYRQFSGTVFVKDIPAGSKHCKSILIDGQNHLLDDHSVWENLVIPLTKVTQKQEEKIRELCRIGGVEPLLRTRTGMISWSEKKTVEIIRATIQFPYILLLDDLDTYYDTTNLPKVLTILDFALNAGSTLVATAKKPVAGFEYTLGINNRTLTLVK